MSTAHAFFVEDVETPTGSMRVVSDEAQRLCAVDWADHQARMLKLLQRYHGPSAVSLRATARRSSAADALAAYFEGDLDRVARLATATNGTAFQRAVWTALRAIPTGSTLSYGALAAAIGRPNAMRAVGAANGANPIAIVIPCHRLIGVNAELTGYGGGLHRKRWLLAHERGERPLFE